MLRHSGKKLFIELGQMGCKNMGLETVLISVVGSLGSYVDQWIKRLTHTDTVNENYKLFYGASRKYVNIFSGFCQE